jgi:hypothetical protein
MLSIIVSTFLIVGLLLLLMFLVLKNTVKNLNERAKTYFVNKLQNYDEIIEYKSRQLDVINEKIRSLENINIEDDTKVINNKFGSSYEIKDPTYKDDTIFKEYKKINEKFNINNEEVIMKFIEENIQNKNNYFYQLLINIDGKLDFDLVYKLILMNGEEQIELLKQIFTSEEIKVLNNYSQNEFSILKFKGYIEELIRKEDPTIYVKVGNKEENYDYLNNLIKTTYDDSLCKGIMIIYKSKLYDYGLS